MLIYHRKRWTSVLWVWSIGRRVSWDPFTNSFTHIATIPQMTLATFKLSALPGVRPKSCSCDASCLSDASHICLSRHDGLPWTDLRSNINVTEALGSKSLSDHGSRRKKTAKRRWGNGRPCFPHPNYSLDVSPLNSYENIGHLVSGVMTVKLVQGGHGVL